MGQSGLDLKAFAAFYDVKLEGQPALEACLSKFPEGDLPRTLELLGDPGLQAKPLVQGVIIESLTTASSVLTKIEASEPAKASLRAAVMAEVVGHLTDQLQADRSPGTIKSGFTGFMTRAAGAVMAFDIASNDSFVDHLRARLGGE